MPNWTQFSRPSVVLLMPHVMEFNRSACDPEPAQVARALGLAGAETDGGRLADLAIAGVADLFHAIGIPRNLSELGLGAEQRQCTAEQALAAQRFKNNPRALDLDPMTSIIEAHSSASANGLAVAHR